MQVEKIYENWFTYTIIKWNFFCEKQNLLLLSLFFQAKGFSDDEFLMMTDEKQNISPHYSLYNFHRKFHDVSDYWTVTLESPPSWCVYGAKVLPWQRRPTRASMLLGLLQNFTTVSKEASWKSTNNFFSLNSLKLHNILHSSFSFLINQPH